MIKRKLSKSDIFIILANLVPVFGVWFLGWSALEVFIVYALETIIIGILTLLKLGIATLYKGKDNWYNQGQTSRVSGLFFMLFFIMHFGLFAAAQTTIFAQSAGITPSGSGLMHFFFHWYEYVNQDIAWMLGAFLISHLVRTFIPFIAKQEYKTVSMMRLMFQPYGRIFIQQFIVILGSMFLTFGLGKVFILIFAGVKIFFEVFIDYEGIINKGMDDLEKNSGKQ